MEKNDKQTRNTPNNKCSLKLICLLLIALWLIILACYVTFLLYSYSDLYSSIILLNNNGNNKKCVIHPIFVKCYYIFLHIILLYCALGVTYLVFSGKNGCCQDSLKGYQNTDSSTLLPSSYPTMNPSANHTPFPTKNPTQNPSTIIPSKYPTIIPTMLPTSAPIMPPTMLPTPAPTYISYSINRQIFTVSGTFTVPQYIVSVRVVVQGGGAGGTSPDNNCCPGGGGGAGGYCEKIVSVTPRQQISVTVGSGGASDQNGGLSSFGSHCTAFGGSVSSPQFFSGGTGGQAIGGDLNLRGSMGAMGHNPWATSGDEGGMGGNSFFLGNGHGKPSPYADAKANSGSGGGGGYWGDTIGGRGGSGIIVVYYFM
eukprot:306527_1